MNSITGGATGGLTNVFNSFDWRRIWGTIDETLHNKNVIYVLVALMTLFVVFFHSMNPAFVNEFMGNELGRVAALVLVAFLTSISPLLGVFAALVYIVAAFNTRNGNSEGFTDGAAASSSDSTSSTSTATPAIAGANTTAAKASSVKEEILCLDRTVTDYIPAEHREKIDQLKSFKYPSK
jgi:hypothetical protein